MDRERTETGKTHEDQADPAIPLDRARLKLAGLWLAGSGLVGLMLVAQSLTGKYHDKVQEVWSWALPTILPVLSLILTVLGAGALVQDSDKSQVKRGFFRIAYLLSVIYLLLVTATIVLEPFTSFESLALMKLSNLWLAPFQALVTSALGALFFSKQAHKE